MIYIIVPVFNRVKVTQQFLKLLSKQEYTDYKVLVVDDGSTDGTFELIKNEFPDVQIVKGNGNWWWTKSVNEGIRCAWTNRDCSSVLLMNDDTYFERDYLTKINYAHNQVPGSIVGSLSLTYDRPYRVFFSGIKKFKVFTSKGCRYHEPFQIVDKSTLTGLQPSLALPGRGVLIPIEIIKKHGLFDEDKLPQYGADFSYITKLYKKHGVTSFVSWDAQIFSYTELTGEGSSFTGESLAKFLRSFVRPMTRQYLPDRWEICKVRYGHWLGAPALLVSILRSIYGYFKRRNMVTSES